MITLTGLLQAATELSEKAFAKFETDIRQAAGTLSKCSIFSRVTDNNHSGVSYGWGGIRLDVIL